MRAQRVLIVDDEAETHKYLGANLRARGYEVLSADDGRTALRLVGEHQLDLIVLDLSMPGMDGFAVCAAVRRQASTPILILSARGQERDIVRALDLGADDYLTKPFGVDEMLARVRAVLRRAGQGLPAQRPPLTVDELTIDFGLRRVLIGGQPVALTTTEYDLLAHLALNAGRVLTHRQLLQAVWGAEYGDEAEYLWAYVRRLRRKIEPNPSNPRYILTQAGVGYAFAAR